MKTTSSLRYRRLVFAGMVVLAFSFAALDQLFLGSSLQAQTAAPSANAAPAAPGAEVDKDTGKPIVTTPTGLKYSDFVVGTGADVKTGDQIVVKYTGKLTTGAKFDSSADHPDQNGGFTYTQGVTSLIAGWTEGTSTMKVGGKRKLIIPPLLGYGQRAMGNVIPANSTLIFEIEVISSGPAK